MRPWKTPNRPAHDISQAFNDGIVRICSLTDIARPGYKPVTEETEVCRLEYAERKLGIQRYFSGQQNQIEVSRVIRVQIPAQEITNQMIAVTEDGKRYTIRLVQNVRDSYPPCYDLTLERITQKEGKPDEVG